MWCSLGIVLGGSVFPSWVHVIETAFGVCSVGLIATDSCSVALRTDCFALPPVHNSRGQRNAQWVVDALSESRGHRWSGQGLVWLLLKECSLCKCSHKSFDVRTWGEKVKASRLTLRSRVEFPNISCFNGRSGFSFSLYDFSLIHCYLVTSKDLETSISTHIL